MRSSRGAMSWGSSFFSIFCQIYFGFFGATLLLYPAMFWGESELTPVVFTFWNGSMAIQAEWFARSMGNLMLVIHISPTFFSMPTMTFFKMQIPLNIVYIALFTWVIFTTENICVEWYVALYLPVFAAIAIASTFFVFKSSEGNKNAVRFQ